MAPSWCSGNGRAPTSRTPGDREREPVREPSRSGGNDPGNLPASAGTGTGTFPSGREPPGDRVPALPLPPREPAGPVRRGSSRPGGVVATRPGGNPRPVARESGNPSAAPSARRTGPTLRRPGRTATVEPGGRPSPDARKPPPSRPGGGFRVLTLCRTGRSDRPLDARGGGRGSLYRWGAFPPSSGRSIGRSDPPWWTITLRYWTVVRYLSRCSAGIIHVACFVRLMTPSSARPFAFG